ncbi:MAG: DNA-3-methyladenine glycosylase [Candidatus Taylorbacteria bacterium]|nr:DNA-3-methyladenine glycosylase [Candidatus Taylorbacteria bacterium]
MSTLLEKDFFARSTLQVAKGLLCCVLCRKIGKKIIRLPITEVEAYDGPNDKASHAYRGETSRNRVMFGKAGVWYVYFTYGMHWMLNMVTGPEGYPAAVLIRGVEGINGPARLTKFLKIDKRLNGRRAVRKSGLWIEDKLSFASTSAKASADKKAAAGKVQKLPRIGVTYAGEVWSKKLYRFTLLKENSRITKRPLVKKGPRKQTK